MLEHATAGRVVRARNFQGNALDLNNNKIGPAGKQALDESKHLGQARIHVR